MKNGDIANFRLSNQCSAGNGMLLQAMADSVRRARSPSTPTSRSRRELAPKFSYGCAVFLDTDRVNFQKEGFSKEELLAGLAQVLPKNVWQYVVQIPRLAALGTQVRPPGRHAVQPRGRQGAGRLHQGARARAPRSSCTRTPARPARSARRSRRCASSSGAASRRSSASMRRSTSSTRRRTTKRRVCHFCPNKCKRTFIDTQRARRRDQPLHRRLLLREGHRRERRRRCSRSSPSARRSTQAVPEPGRLRGEAARSGTSTSRRRCPRTGAPVKDIEVKKGIFGMRARRDRRGPFQRSSAEALEEAPPHAHRHPARAEHLLDGAVLPHLLRGARHRRSRTWSSATRPPKRCGSRAASTARSTRASRRRSRRRTSTTCSSTTTPTRRSSTTSSSRSSRTCRRSSTNAMDNARCPIVAGAPDVMKAAFTKEVDFFATRGIEYLDPALSFDRADAAAQAACSRRFGPRLGITEDENDHACDEALEGARRSSTTRCEDKGRAILETVEAEDRVAILMIGRPYHSDPGLNHGIPEEFQVLGYPILSIRSIPKDATYLDSLLQGGSREGAHHDAARDQRRVAGELLGRTARRRCGRRSSRRTTRTSCVLDLSSFKCGHDAPTYGIIDGIIDDERRRRTRRSTTSTPTSRAARSRSASRPTRTR